MKKVILAIALIPSMLCGTALSAPILWVGDQSGNLGTVDVTSGTVTVIGNMGQAMTDIAFDNQGNLYATSFTQLFSINKSTAQATTIGNHNLGANKNSLVFDANNTLYAANNSLYTLNVTTGAATLIGNGGTAYNSSGDLAFVAGDLFLSSTYGNDSLVKLNTTNGAATFVGNIGFSAVYGLATNNNIDLYGLTGTQVLSINTSTGAGTSILNYGGKGLFAAWGSAFYEEAGAPIPEPTTTLLVCLGAAGFAAVSRRKRG